MHPYLRGLCPCVTQRGLSWSHLSPTSTLHLCVAWFCFTPFITVCVCVCVRVRACALSLQLRLTLCSPMDCSPPGSSVHGVLQARILDWVSMPSSRGSSQPRNHTYICLLHWQAGSSQLVPLGKPITFKGSLQKESNRRFLFEGRIIPSCGCDW